MPECVWSTRLAFLPMCLGALVLGTSPARPDCPSSTICLTYFGTNCTSYTVPRQSAWQQETFAGSYAYTQIAYDLIAGTIQGSSSGNPPAGAGSIANGFDDFTLFGVPAGTPESIVSCLRVVLSGSVDPGSCGGSVDARASGSLTEMAGGREVAFEDQAGGYIWPCTASFYTDTTLRLPLQITAGVPFRLRYSAGSAAGGYYWANTSATVSLQFEGLPAGSSIVSCQGFVSGSAVPAREMSWGRLKRLYR